MNRTGQKWLPEQRIKDPKSSLVLALDKKIVPLHQEVISKKKRK